MGGSNLRFRAGRTALSQLRERGFTLDQFRTLVGASGGPKWLVLSQMDRVLAKRLFESRRDPLATVGTSIGAFRHACFAQSNPVDAIERFEAAYIAQSYTGKPTPRQISEVSADILDLLFGSGGRKEILEHPFIATHVIAARSRGLLNTDARFPMALGFAQAAIMNFFSRSLLARCFERTVFHAGYVELGFSGFDTHHVPLTEANIDKALLASGSIPLVMSGVDRIPGARPGYYRDGGVIDYHFDFEFDAPEGLMLYPHFFDEITPGWFDKSLSWRKPCPSGLDRVLMITPSPEFVASLPGGHVPDRGDFLKLSTEDRQAQWRQVVDRCRVLADELSNCLDKGRLPQDVELFSI